MLEKVKEVIKSFYSVASCGIYSCRNYIGDPMSTVFSQDGVQIDICYVYEYFEIFGLTDAEFAEVVQYYNSLK